MGTLVLSFLVTIVIVFGGMFFAFKKFSSGKKPFSSGFYWLTSIILTPCIYIGVIFVWLSVSSSYEKKPFDADRWAADRHTRYEYVDDLIDNNKIQGLTSSEVVSMLGEADQVDDTAMVYYIGYCPKHFFNMDPDWLVGNLSDGKVSNVYVRE
jgi:hypothetical protein